MDMTVAMFMQLWIAFMTFFFQQVFFW